VTVVILRVNHAIVYVKLVSMPNFPHPLFSGAGGLDIGFHRAGFKIVACVEIGLKISGIRLAVDTDAFAQLGYQLFYRVDCADYGFHHPNWLFPLLLSIHNKY